MRSTINRLDKGLFLTVHRYTIVYCIIINCRLLIKFCLIFENLFQRSSGMQWFDFWSLIVDLCGPNTGAFLILAKLFSRSSFYGMACFSIQSLLVDHIWILLQLQKIFWEGPVLKLLYLIVDHLYGCFPYYRGLYQ